MDICFRSRRLEILALQISEKILNLETFHLVMAEPESSRSVPRRKISRGKGLNFLSCSDIFLTLAFVAFAATTCFYAVQFVFVRSLP